jgi:predicted dehydrogenase
VSNSATLRCGILGTGWILGKYAEAMRLIDSASLAGVASRDADRAKAAASHWGIPNAHGSYESLINDPDIDIVINGLHNGLHCEWTIRALQAGKHVLCEKPLACSAGEVDRMFAAAHVHKRWLLEGFMYRFHPQMAEAKRRVARGDIGRVLYIRSSRTTHGRSRDNPRFSIEAGGGALLDIGCYCVNFSRFLAGAEPERIVAQSNFDPETGVDLTLSGTLEFANGLTAHFVCSFEGEPTYAAEVFGTEGKLLIPDPWLPPHWPTALILARGGKSETIRIEPPAIPQHSLTPFALEVQHFCDCVGENRPPQFPPECDAEQDSRANARVMDALAESARSSKIVECGQAMKGGKHHP